MLQRPRSPLRRFRRYLQDKHLTNWILSDIQHRLSLHRMPHVEGPRHLLFAICDHYEPLWGGASIAQGDRRVQAWEQDYPALAKSYRDADGRPPRYSFFFPGEEYQPSYLERLAHLVEQDLGEVELHLHHENDTAENLRHTIFDALEKFAKHGHISRDPQSGVYRYAFIHGNWCLANGRADGRMCGVDEELPLLYETGCYADFTFPSAPDETQPRRINQIYWPIGDISRKRAYEYGERAKVGHVKNDRLLLLQGPLTMTGRRAWPPLRIENSHLTDNDPPTPKRIRDWVQQQIHVAGRPEWIFVKVHTHGAPEATAQSLLGHDGHKLHQTLTQRYNDGQHWKLHYVTAREMYNIAIAAMEGHSGDPNAYRDHRISPPPRAAGHNPSLRAERP